MILWKTLSYPRTHEKKSRFGNLKSCHTPSCCAVESHHYFAFSLILNSRQILGILLKPVVHRLPGCSTDLLVEKFSSLLGFLGVGTNLLECSGTNCSYFLQAPQSFSGWRPDSHPMLLLTQHLLGLSISPGSLRLPHLVERAETLSPAGTMAGGSLHAKLQSRTKLWARKPILSTMAAVVWASGHGPIRAQMKDSSLVLGKQYRQSSLTAWDQAPALPGTQSAIWACHGLRDSPFSHLSNAWQLELF